MANLLLPLVRRRVTPTVRPSRVRRRPIPRRLQLLATLGALAASCDTEQQHVLRGVLEGAGLEDRPRGSPLDVGVLCDPSPGSTCNTSSVALTLERTARAVFDHPGSEVSVWMQGDEPAATRRVATIVVPAAVDRGERAARAAEERFVASVRAALCPAVEAVLRERPPRQSPIAEALDEIALARNSARPGVVIAATDGREHSQLADFECAARLPSPEVFEARLRRRGLLGAQSFARTTIIVVSGDHDSAPRRHCPVSMGRERQVQTLWRHALAGAGAVEVGFYPDAISVDELRRVFTRVSSSTPPSPARTPPSATAARRAQ